MHALAIVAALLDLEDTAVRSADKVSSLSSNLACKAICINKERRLLVTLQLPSPTFLILLTFLVLCCTEAHAFASSSGRNHILAASATTAGLPPCLKGSFNMSCRLLQQPLRLPNQVGETANRSYTFAGATEAPPKATGVQALSGSENQGALPELL